MPAHPPSAPGARLDPVDCPPRAFGHDAAEAGWHGAVITTSPLIYVTDLTRVFAFKPDLAIFLRTTDARPHDRIGAANI
jgi:hypothetical protein